MNIKKDVEEITMYNRKEIMEQAPVLVTEDKVMLQAYQMALKNLYTSKKISMDDALLKTSRPEEFKRMVGLG